MKRVTALSFLLVFATLSQPYSAEIPFPDALERAAIELDSLDSILEDALILGNGDINALLWTEGGNPSLMLTKNDVWDARLDSKLDPPIPTLDLIRKLGKEAPGSGDPVFLPSGWAARGQDSYHAHPYPCPRACAQLRLGSPDAHASWRSIRAQGRENHWSVADTGAVMSIQGAAEASNGYALDLPAFSTSEYDRLRIRISGTPNARYYIDLMSDHNEVVFKTGWTETPTESAERVWELPADASFSRIILYTWTEDGATAENHFQQIQLEGPGGSKPIDLTARAVTPAGEPGRLDIRRAVASVEGPLAAEIRALADRNVFLIRTTADAYLVPVTSADTPAAVPGDRDGVTWLEQTMPGDLDWPGMSYAVALAAKGEWKAVAVVTSREADEPKDAAIELALETLNEKTDRLIGQHEAAWSDFWSRSGVRLDDEFLSDTWYRNLYFLRCVTKQGVIPPGLFASLVDSAPAWHGDYHTNYNIQQTFWSAYNTNHPDMAEPYAALIRGYLPRARWLCNEIFGFDGAYFPHVLFAYEPEDPEACESPVGRQYIHHVWGFTMGVPAFTVQPVWWHYKYEPNRRFLKDTAYPLVRDVAVFQANFMDACERDAEGRVVLGPTVSPEHWGWTEDFLRNRNSTFDIAMFRYIFKAAIEGATILGVDSDWVERWQTALEQLPAFPTTNEDAPVVVDVQGAPPITYNIAVPVVPVFPADVITTFSSDADKALFARTVENTKWNGNNSIYIMGVSRARLSLPETRAWLTEEIRARLRPNQTITLNRLGAGFNDFGHYTEQFGATMAIGELLLQSVGDRIRVFPAWPAGVDAEFENLRTQGGFLVSAKQEDGSVTRLEIESTAGGTLRLLSPWPRAAMRTQDKLEILQPGPQGLLVMETEPGQKLSFFAAR